MLCERFLQPLGFLGPWVKLFRGERLGTSAQGIAPNREGWGPLVPEVIQVPGDDIEALSVLMSERSNEIAAVLTRYPIGKQLDYGAGVCRDVTAALLTRLP